MHALFLNRAISLGMDMAIVNASSLPAVDEIPTELHEAIEDVLWRNPGHDASERLIAIASRILEEKTVQQEPLKQYRLLALVLILPKYFPIKSYVVTLTG